MITILETRQHIEIYRVNRADMLAVDSDDVFTKLRVLPTVFHEVRHWVDHVSTLWGQRNLVSGFNAVHAFSAQKETEFWRVIEHRRVTHRDRFEAYFTTINDRNPPEDGRLKWEWELSCGIGFDSDGKPNEKRPIVFTRFRWQDKRLACRVPFSVASLLESNAMHWDLGLEVSLLPQIPDGVRQVEEQESIWGGPLG